MRHASCVTFWGALLSTTVLSSAWAGDTPTQAVLDTVTVYATKSEQSTFDVPAMVSSVDADAPGAALASDVDDLLNTTPGVDVVNGPRRNGQTVSIRGFDDEAIITLMDGRRQNFEAEHDGRFFVDPSLLKRVEIVKGASSSIYGGGGIGGVVAFETKNASDMLKPGQTVGATTSLGYRSGNKEFSPLLTGYGRVGTLDILGSIAYRNSGDIRTGGGGHLDAEDKVLSGLFNAAYSFADWHTVRLQYQGLNNNAQEPNNGAGGVGLSNPIVDKTVQDHQIGVKYDYSNPDNALLNLKVHAYYNDTEVEEEDLSGSNAGRVQSRAMQTLGLTIDNQSRFQISDSHSQTLSYGFEIYRDEQQGTSSVTADGTRPGVPDAENLNFGLYIQDEIAFSTGIGKFLVIPAVRYDNYRSEADTGNDQSEDAVSPKIALSYKPTDNFVLFGSLAQAFRAPNMTELYPTGQHFPGFPPMFPNNNFIPNPDLKPEKVTTVELGAGVNFDDLLADNDRLKLKGSWHSSRGEDFITQEIDIFAGTSRNLNIDKARLWGWELEGEYNLHPVTLKTGLSYVEAKDDETGEYIANNVPLTFSTDIAYSIDSLSSVIGWRARFADANDKVGSADERTAGYGVHDLYYRWAPTDGDLQNLTVDLGISNLFDREYNKRYAALFEEGRSFGAKVTYTW
ncbi:TonB-dependent hemoglobin/transferrin/lactoferrin family receptor [Sneathiella chinensis]|uniref:Ligand-gated channel protein n=1 Tax=Sneathiella chinensis TaxID=349750 RepID=A0ABQ5U0B7_9PROT|nr:TonB-dependent hemoglobin/transferrin/lactoferrin family receptor [Sneathiella chinensis]GLQ04782.1 ligand-gated channel protein [Sneathiella chinensis]